MNRIEVAHKAMKRIYDQGGAPLDQICELTCLAIDKLAGISTEQYRGISGKDYFVYVLGSFRSRPIRSSLMLSDTTSFRDSWTEFLASIDGQTRSSTMDTVKIDSVLYTAIMGFASCFDIWKPKSRKTPGTHFEVLLGSVLTKFLPDLARSKFIPLPNQDEKLSTDIVFGNERGGIVIPAKITTRERIVQPYAHQRILDSIFPEGRYRSILMCVSETQRDDDETAVNEICVPGTVRLFQTHLSSLSGIYYLDPPARYMQEDVAALVRVGSYGTLLRNDLAGLALFTTLAPLVAPPAP